MSYKDTKSVYVTRLTDYTCMNCDRITRQTKIKTGDKGPPCKHCGASFWENTKELKISNLPPDKRPKTRKETELEREERIENHKLKRLEYYKNKYNLTTEEIELFGGFDWVSKLAVILSKRQNNIKTITPEEMEIVDDSDKPPVSLDDFTQ